MLRPSITRTAVATALVMATGAAGIAAAPTASAADTATPKVKTTRMDIDGDGRRDTTTMRLKSVKSGAYTYTIETRTARGQRASVDFRVEDNGESVDSIWWGAAGLDGTPGAEIVVNPSPVGDGVVFRAYRWSKGRLVAETAPGRVAGRSGSDLWSMANMPWLIEGYTFSTSRGVRYVTAHDLAPTRTKGIVSGTHTTYAWNARTATWKKTSTKKSGLISDHYAQQKYAGIFGVTFR